MKNIETTKRVVGGITSLCLNVKGFIHKWLADVHMREWYMYASTISVAKGFVNTMRHLLWLLSLHVTLFIFKSLVLTMAAVGEVLKF